eukprot:gene42837-56942_t
MAADIPLAIDHFRYFAGCIRAQEGSVAQIDDTTYAYHFHEPLGNESTKGAACMGVLTALAILAGLVVVHEAGHFFAATWQGIRGYLVGIPSGFSTTPGVLVSAVQPNQAAAAAGLKAGDRILALAGQPLAGGQDAVADLVTTIKGSPERTLTLLAERD